MTRIHTNTDARHTQTHTYKNTHDTHTYARTGSRPGPHLLQQNLEARHAHIQTHTHKHT